MKQKTKKGVKTKTYIEKGTIEKGVYRYLTKKILKEILEKREKNLN